MVTYSKLNDGTWGIRSETQLVKGDIAIVTTKAGRTHTVEITGIVWNNGKVWLARCNRVNIPASLAVAMLSSQSRRIMMELEQAKQNPQGWDAIDGVQLPPVQWAAK